MPRIKSIFPTHEIPHLWAHQTQSYAKNRQGNLFFDGDTIYSYGRHFPIAKMTDYQGKRAVLFNANGSSSTTKGHKHAVREGIPFDTPIFMTDDLYWGFIGAQTYADNQCKQAYKALKAAKSNPSKAVKWDVLKREETCRESLYQFLGEAYVPTYVNGSVDIIALEGVLIEHNTKTEERRALAEQRRREKNARYMAEWAAQDTESARQRLLTEEELRQEWRDGKRIYINKSCLHTPTMLRINGDKVETSMGAEFPLAHAKRHLILVKRLVEERESVADSELGATLRLGHYKVDKIENGVIFAGCHRIEPEETLRFIEQLSKIKTEEQESKYECV